MDKIKKATQQLQAANRNTEAAIMALDFSQVPDWPKHCRQCLSQNNLDPNVTIYCDPDIDCPYYPFKEEKVERRYAPNDKYQ